MIKSMSEQRRIEFQLRQRDTGVLLSMLARYQQTNLNDPIIKLLYKIIDERKNETPAK